MTPTDTPTLTVEQAAKRMRRTPTWVAQLLTAGRIRGEKQGHCWHVDAASLEEFIANGRREVVSRNAVRRLRRENDVP